MILRLVLILLLCSGSVISQNNIIIFSSNAGLFSANIKGGDQIDLMNQEVKFTSLKMDTLDLVIRTKDNLSLTQRLFLLQKAKSVMNKEFVYALELDQNKKLKLVFMSVHDLKKLPDPLLPQKPAEDTTYKWRNNVFGTLFELKNGKPSFYFNLPKNGECKEGMTAANMDHATAYLNRMTIDYERFESAQEIVKNNCITCKQLTLILNCLKFELDKLKLVKNAYVNLVDKKDMKVLESCFRFESSKKEFGDLLANPKSMIPEQNKIICTKAVKDSTVMELASEIKLFATDYQRYRFMKEKAPGYCFTCVQFKGILELFVHDREKLDLTKLFYNNLTDKESMNVLKEVFSYKESVIDLENFLKNN